MDFSKLLDGPSLWNAVVGIVTAVVVQYANWAVQRRKMSLESSAALRQADTADREAAVKQLLEVVTTLRKEVTVIREELAEEREMRKAAEEEVRDLRDELQELRHEMQRQGLSVPPAPPAAVSSTGG